jgi:hypothetical protein
MIHPMNFLSIVKIALSPFPPGAVFNQVLAEVESAEMKRRIEILENPLAHFGDDAKPLCHLLYDGLKAQSAQLSNKVSWSDELEPYLKTLRRFEAQGMVGGAPALGRQNEFLMGIGLAPEFIVYLALISDDNELCKALSAYLDGLDPGKGVNGREIQGNITLPLPVIDAFLSVYEKQGQGIKSREIGASYYVAK